MSDMKCPFCGQEMIIPKEEVRKGIQCCVCRNPKCEFDGWHFPVKIITALIDTKKKLDDLSDKNGKLKSKLDIAIDALIGIEEGADYLYIAQVTASDALEEMEQIDNKEQQ